MLHAVITGASQGLGRALLDAFLERGCSVSFCARSAERVAAITTELGAAGHGGRVLGMAADVTQRSDLQRFREQLVQAHGPVAVWINNAGHARGGSSFCELPADAFEHMVATNLLGTANACRVALSLLREQRAGALYNVVGAGADGRPVAGMLGYGTTKCALQYLTDGLAREHAGSGVHVGSISPGLVLTEAVTRNLQFVPPAARAARLAHMNVIAELPITSARWIVECTTRRSHNGARFVWLTRRRLLVRRLTSRWWPRDVVERSGLAREPAAG